MNKSTLRNLVQAAFLQQKHKEEASPRTANLVKFMQDVGIKSAAAVFAHPLYIKHCIDGRFPTQYIVRQRDITVHGPRGTVVFAIEPGSSEVESAYLVKQHAA